MCRMKLRALYGYSVKSGGFLRLIRMEAGKLKEKDLQSGRRLNCNEKDKWRVRICRKNITDGSLWM